MRIRAVLFVLFAVNAPEIWCQSEETRAKLAATDAKIRDVRAAIDEALQREKSELVQIDQIEKLVALLADQLSILDDAVREQQRRVEEAERKMSLLEADFALKKTALKERLVVLYKMGELSYARLLLSVDDAANLARAYVYVSKMVEADQQKVEDYRDALRALEVERESFEKKRVELGGLKQANAAKRAELEGERVRRRAALEQIKKEKGRSLQMLGELEAAAQELRKLLNELPPSSSTQQLNLGRFKGSLKWPHAAKVTLGFGLHRHPQYNTITVQNGVDIAVPFGEPVASVFGGRVAFADWFRGYGYLVILDHGDKYFSLYAHLSRFAIGLGDEVSAGQILGYAGDTGSLKGAYLYFELRHGEKPLNPVDWLEKRK